MKSINTSKVNALMTSTNTSDALMTSINTSEVGALMTSTNTSDALMTSINASEVGAPIRLTSGGVKIPPAGNLGGSGYLAQ